jgi:hypothetical protein
VKKFWVKGGLIHFSKLELSFFEKFSIYLQNRSVSVFFFASTCGRTYNISTRNVSWRVRCVCDDGVFLVKIIKPELRFFVGLVTCARLIFLGEHIFFSVCTLRLFFDASGSIRSFGW